MSCPEARSLEPEAVDEKGRNPSLNGSTSLSASCETGRRSSGVRTSQELGMYVDHLRASRPAMSTANRRAKSRSKFGCMAANSEFASAVAAAGSGLTAGQIPATQVAAAPASQAQ